MTKSTPIKNERGSSPPDEVLYSKITQAKPVSTVPACDSKKIRTKFVAVRPKRIPKVSKTSSPSASNKESSATRLKSTVRRRKNFSVTDFEENPPKPKNLETNVDVFVKNTDDPAETLGKENPEFDNPTNDSNMKMPPPTSTVLDDEDISMQANFDIVPESTENVQDEVIPDTPENEDEPEKEKVPENEMLADASDTNTVVNSPPNESMET
ncbi:hypothetical protein A2U01_0027008, partial [Trifolium medium]|nr:hypothetical protein [Trifolium medium]